MIDSVRCSAGGVLYPRGRYLETVLSPRAGGLAVRLNLNPDASCSFNCVYCDTPPLRAVPIPGCVDLEALFAELVAVLGVIRSGAGRTLPGLQQVPDEYLQFRHVALCGEGEPTLCVQLEEVIDRLTHLRSLGEAGRFPIVLMTNGSRLNDPDVRRAIRLLKPEDEIWAKLDRGTEPGFREINRSEVAFGQVLDGLEQVGSERPIVIQTLVPRWRGRFLSIEEQEAFGECIANLERRRTRIQAIQLYSVLRPSPDPDVTHASLAELTAMAQRVRPKVRAPIKVY